MKDFTRVRSNPTSVSKYIFNHFFHTFDKTPHLIPKYLNYCAIISQISHYTNERVIKKYIFQIYQFGAEVILQPKIFNDPQLLLEFDKSLIAIYDADRSLFKHRPRTLLNKDIA